MTSDKTLKDVELTEILRKEKKISKFIRRKKINSTLCLSPVGY